MSQSQVWKKKIGGLTNKLTEQRQRLSLSDTSRKAMVAATSGQQKAGLKRRDN
jgi:hypothetical protein